MLIENVVNAEDISGDTKDVTGAMSEGRFRIRVKSLWIQADEDRWRQAKCRLSARFCCKTRLSADFRRPLIVIADVFSPAFG